MRISQVWNANRFTSHLLSEWEILDDPLLALIIMHNFGKLWEAAIIARWDDASKKSLFRRQMADQIIVTFQLKKRKLICTIPNFFWVDVPLGCLLDIVKSLWQEN